MQQKTDAKTFFKIWFLRLIHTAEHNSQLFFYPLDLTAVRLGLFVVINSDEQQISTIIFQRIRVVSLFDLGDCAVDILIPFEFNQQSRLASVQFSRKKTDVCKSFPSRKLPDNRVIFPCKIERKMNGAA